MRDEDARSHASYVPPHALPVGAVAGSGAGRVSRGARLLGLAALLLAALPYLVGFLVAPRGAIFLGALNNLGDTGQYLAALRQGAEGHLLYVNQYTSLRVPPVLIYPVYTAAGWLLSPLHLAPLAAYQLLHAVAAVALLWALWRFCAAARPARPVLGFALALFGAGLYAPALLLSGLVRLPIVPAALTAPEFSTFTTLLISPHGALGLAAELWALTGYLRWRRDTSARHLPALAFGGLILGLCYPFGLPVLLAVIVVDLITPHPPPHGADWSLGSAEPTAQRTSPSRGEGEQNLVSPLPSEGKGLGVRGRLWPALSLLPALGVALYYAVLFHFDPLWGASNMLRLPPPGFAVLAGAFGPLLALGLRGALSGRADRLLVTWAVVNGLLLLAPLPQSERLLMGWSVPLALLGATALERESARAARRWGMALSLSSVLLALLYVMMTATGGNPAYYEPAAEADAVSWVAAHAGPGDVVMASAGSGNLIVSAARCRVVVGQNFETFNWARAQRAVLRYYDAATPAAERTAILRQYGVTLVLAGPYERSLGRFTPAAGRDYRLVHVSGPVRVFAVERG